MNARDNAYQESSAIGRPIPHESAALHVSGEATYIDDIPELAGTLHVALGLSNKAHANIVNVNLDAVRTSPGVIDVLLAKDIPGKNSCGPILADDPILAGDAVQYIGQPIFAVVAESYEAARVAAQRGAIQYADLPAELSPLAAARKKSLVVPAMQRSRGGATEALATAPHRLQGQFQVGGQEQFYLEGQISYAIPTEGSGIRLYCSTQHPSEMQHLVAHALDVSSNQVVVETRRMGGGFGGKE